MRISDWSSDVCSSDLIDSALSGGYDSRLLLALARDAKLAPRLHVYGRPGDSDVVCAQAIARAEGLALHHVDKSTVPQPEPARYPDIVHANYLAFDGRSEEHTSELQSLMRISYAVFCL